MPTCAGENLLVGRNSLSLEGRGQAPVLSLSKGEGDPPHSIYLSPSMGRED